MATAGGTPLTTSDSTSGTTFRFISATTTAAALLLVLMGAYVQVSGAELACPDWPTCDGQWVPSGDAGAWAAWGYRLATGAVSLLAGVLALHTWMGRGTGGRTAFYATLALSLAVLHALTSGLTVMLHAPGLLVAATHGVGLLLFGVASYVLVLAFRTEPGAAAVATPSLLARVNAAVEPYVTVSKPGILYLLLVSGGAAAYVAAPTAFPWATAALALAGGGLAHVSASAFNCYLERDRDAQMARTAMRPLPLGEVTPGNVLAYAIATGVGSFLLLYVWVNLLTAVLALGAIFYYVVVYTVLLKPRTPQNIVIGGAAGSFACLVGWAGVTGEVSLVPLAMGLLVFVWTPPHFWALALVHKADYEKAGFPMMPVVKGVRRTQIEIFVYTFLMVATSLVLVWPLGAVGWVYGAGAVALGVPAIWLAWRLLKAEKLTKPGYALFWYSIAYLGALFLLMVVDRVVLV